MRGFLLSHAATRELPGELGNAACISTAKVLAKVRGSHMGEDRTGRPLKAELERGKRRDRVRPSTCWFTPLMTGDQACARQKPGVWSLSIAGNRGPRPRAILFCFPRSCMGSIVAVCTRCPYSTPAALRLVLQCQPPDVFSLWLGQCCDAVG